MDFKELSLLVKAKFDEMSKKDILFVSSVNGYELWDIYLKSFETREIFKSEDVNKCNLCNNFFRRYGNIVALTEGFVEGTYTIETMFHIDLDPSSEYFKPIDTVRTVLINNPIKTIFLEEFEYLRTAPYEKGVRKGQEKFQLGIKDNVRTYTEAEAEGYQIETGKPYLFNHFHIFLPGKFVVNGSAATELSNRTANKEVFERMMKEVSLQTLETISELYKNKSLLNFKPYEQSLENITKLKKEYDQVKDSQKENWIWLNFHRDFKFRNNLAGTLAVDIQEGKLGLNACCLKYNKAADPANWNKAKAPITDKMKNEVAAYIEEHGYTSSFDRRFATIDDINFSEILHSNAAEEKVKTASMFDKIKTIPTEGNVNLNTLKDVPEVSIEDFMRNILPRSTYLECLFENRLEKHLVSLTTANKLDSKPIFKWSNNFTKTFKDGLAGVSMIKEAVKEKGGNVEGVLRFSIMWAEDDPSDNSDLDAWCTQPDGVKIGYSSGYRKDRGDKKTSLGGQLDVDITNPSFFKNKNIVENIVFDNIKLLKNGDYLFTVNMYSNRGAKGFKAEIEFDNQIHEYQKIGAWNGHCKVGTVSYDKNGLFSINNHMPSTQSSRQFWNLDTNKFHKVNLMCLSPNYWGENNVGNKYFMFMLENCASDEPLRSFHVEDLIGELYDQRKVLEVLGEVTKIEPSKPQLAGLGFSEGHENHAYVRVTKDNNKKLFKIKF
jgi:hypothetical protein